MPKTKHKLSKRVFQFPEHVDESIIKGVKCQEYVLSEQEPGVVAQLLKILAMPPAVLSHRDWTTRLGPKERGLVFDDREATGPVPVYFVQVMGQFGQTVVHVKPMSGA